MEEIATLKTQHLSELTEIEESLNSEGSEDKKGKVANVLQRQSATTRKQLEEGQRGVLKDKPLNLPQLPSRTVLI